MYKINPLIVNANGKLDSTQQKILSATSKAQAFAFDKLKINWDIDVLFSNQFDWMIIPEDSVGGQTITSDFIEFALNEKTATEWGITEMLIHELCHAARWGKNPERMETLFQGIINEGIATYLEAEYARHQKHQLFFIKSMINRSDAENIKILSNLQDHLDDTSYDYPKIFSYGDHALPRWSGYSLGYYLVKQYLNKSQKSIFDVYADNYSSFKL